jgi:hypothetical protein
MFEQAAYTQRRDGAGALSERSLLLYRSARDRGRRGQFWSRLTGKPRGLLDLRDVEGRCDDSLGCEALRRTVPIDQIQGSGGRAGDFDRDFNPLKDHVRRRWLGIAAAREQGAVLPPVSLVQVGTIYFVKDGHHRISVAKAFGQEAIEAKVVVWQGEGALDRETVARESLNQPKTVEARGGFIVAASTLGEASVFTIVLPVGE